MIPDTLRHRLHVCKKIIVFTGAGISAESGIPTFRDRFEGLWAHYDPQDIATPHAFRANPQLVWDWHVHLAETIRRARPNPGHVAVACLQRHVPNLTVVTQNIDNLHQAAGSCEVVELHGNLFRLKAFIDTDELFAGNRSPIICPVCDGYALDEECDPYASREDLAAIELKAGPVPCCPGCRAMLRPDIVWFGEPLAHDAIDAAWQAIDACDLFICVGSSLEVQPAASLPWRAQWRGATVIEINMFPTELSRKADLFLQGSAATLLPELIEDVWGPT
jgi:NAD-dependent deacetylase